MWSGPAPRSAALTDVVFLAGLAPSSLAPMSIPEMHLYAYLANLVALNGGVPVADWGYPFAVTTEGFPFAAALKEATDSLARRSVVVVARGTVVAGDDLFVAETDLLDGLAQSGRRKEWLRDALACGLHLPHGAVRDAINHSPGMVTSLRHGRAGALLRDPDIDALYDEFELVKSVLGAEAEERLQPFVLWLSARVISNAP